MGIRGSSRSAVVRARSLLAGLIVLTMFAVGPPAEPAAAQVCRAKPTDADVARLKDLRTARPRLLATASDVSRAASISLGESGAAALRARVKRAADGLVGRAPESYRRVGPRLQFHTYKNRIATLAVAWKLEGDRRYAVQAERELLGAARFADWNPRHYLDTAEMTAATAMGYDWFYDVLPAKSRAKIRDAIVNKGLRTSLCFYRHGNGPTARTNNWGIVTNAGLAMGAIAVADTNPRIAAAVLGGALKRVRPAMARYGSDGTYPEGLGYWRYSTEHAVKLLSTLRSSFGREFNVAPAGFAKTGNHPLQAIGPTGKAANFGNTRESLGSAPHLFWLARRYNRPVDAWLARQQLGNAASPLHLLWYALGEQDPASAGMSRSWLSPKLNSVFLRSAWNEPAAGYVAVKGGSNWVSHAQPELGSFVYDARGQRWGLDLGLDDYNLPGYFDVKRRHRWYRVSTQGQNTLTIAGKQQPHTAFAPVTRFTTSSGRAATVVNLTKAYPAARNVKRGVALLDGDSLLVQDEIAAERVRSVDWAMHTRASISVSADGQFAELVQGGERVVAQILTPRNGSARFSVVSAEKSPPQATNKGVRKLMVRTQTGRRPTARSLSRLRLTVVLTPGGPAAAPPPVTPLSGW
jgi:hypothetical protein